MSEAAAFQARRVVTGHDPHGSPVVWIDATADNTKHPAEGIRSTLLWATTETPARYDVDTDAGELTLGTAPPSHGSRFVVLTLDPGAGAESPLHRTDSVDFVVCHEGVVTAVLSDDRSVNLGPGDVMVQRGTPHAWRNEHDTTAVLFVVLLDGAPKRDGSLAAADEAR